MPTPYEKSRAENIKRNRELLLSLELDELKKYVPPKTVKEGASAAGSRKRKSPPPQDTKDENESNTKVSKTCATQDITNTSGVRRSARNAGRAVDYKSEVAKTSPLVISTAAKIAMNSESKKTSERRHTPYVIYSPLAMQLLTATYNVGNGMEIFPISKLANGGRQGTSHSKYYRLLIKHVCYREACSADSIHA